MVTAKSSFKVKDVKLRLIIAILGVLASIVIGLFLPEVGSFGFLLTAWAVVIGPSEIISSTKLMLVPPTPPVTRPNIQNLPQAKPKIKNTKRRQNRKKKR